MAGEFWTNLFYSLLTELFVAIIAFFVKDNRRLQVQILAIGTILAGTVAFINPSTIFRSTTFPPTNTPIKNTEIPATLAYEPAVENSNAPYFSLFLSSYLMELSGNETLTMWSILIICPDCEENNSFTVYTSPNELDVDSPEWKFSETTKDPISAYPGVWYKVEILDSLGEPYSYLDTRTIHCCDGN